MILVTGGAGFIGANFVLDWLSALDEPVLNLDKLTYAGNPENLAALQGDARHVFVQGDIGDAALLPQLLAQHQPRAVVNFAAESHVDRSIHGPEDFIQTNVVGTARLLQSVRAYWQGLGDAERAAFRFLHVSTDEVYGSLGPGDAAFTETHRYEPNSPYSASKAASDHLVRAWHHTYGLPVLTTNCSNNYGPYHFPEKLIPLMIVNALAGKPLPVYGDGQQIRDWLYVADHCSAIRRVLQAGRLGEVYNVGGCIDEHIGPHGLHSSRQAVQIAEVAAQIRIVTARRHQFTQRCQTALQFPANLTVFAKQQNFHDGLGCRSYCLATQSRYAPLCTWATQSGCARYHCTVLRMPVSKVSVGRQPSSCSILRASMA